jgi:hypothetical protein
LPEKSGYRRPSWFNSPESFGEQEGVPVIEDFTRPGEERSWRLATLVLIVAAVAVACALLAGCSSESPTAGPVDPDAARVALKTALEGWKQGKRPDALKAGSPSITVQDRDWDRGARLVDYQIVGDGEAGGSDLRCKVTLTLRPAKGKQAKQEALYSVRTVGSNVSVFREYFP